MYCALYVMYWTFMFGILLLSGFWIYLSCAASIIAWLVRFAIGFKANSGSFDSGPLKVVLGLDLAILAVSFSLLMVFKMEEPFLFLLVWGSLLGSPTGLLIL